MGGGGWCRLWQVHPPFYFFLVKIIWCVFKEKSACLLLFFWQFVCLFGYSGVFLVGPLVRCSKGGLGRRVGDIFRDGKGGEGRSKKVRERPYRKGRRTGDEARDREETRERERERDGLTTAQPPQTRVPAGYSLSDPLPPSPEVPSRTRWRRCARHTSTARLPGPGSPVSRSTRSEQRSLPGAGRTRSRSRFRHAAPSGRR